MVSGASETFRLNRKFISIKYLGKNESQRHQNYRDDKNYLPLALHRLIIAPAYRQAGKLLRDDTEIISGIRRQTANGDGMFHYFRISIENGRRESVAKVGCGLAGDGRVRNSIINNPARSRSIGHPTNDRALVSDIRNPDIGDGERLFAVKRN